MKNTKQFNEFMILLSEKFDKEISPTMSKMIREVLKPFPDEECEKALSHVVSRGEYFKNIMPDLLKFLEVSVEDRAVIAWTAFYKEMMAYCGESIRFSDPVIHSCIEAMGGIEFLSRMTYDDIRWKRKEFCDLYRTYRKGNNHPKQITGTHDQSNAESGFQKFVKAPRFVMIEGGKSEVEQLEG